MKNTIKGNFVGFTNGDPTITNSKDTIKEMKNNKQTIANEPAFPEVQELPQFNRHTYGLTKREYFAAVALQGILAREDNFPYKSKDEFLKSITSISVELADQLIIELNKNDKQ